MPEVFGTYSKIEAVPRYRFGNFDFDSDTGALQRDGSPVKLQPQPAQALALLLAHSGQTVSREKLRAAVWGNETFVDYENGLNFCIAQIRSALRDSAESPRYIRTVPRQGYQFIAPILTPPATPSHNRRRTLAVAATAGSLLLLAAAAYAIRTQSSQPPAVAVFRLDNNTGNPLNDRVAEVLTDSLIADLTEAGARAYAVIGNDARLLRPRAQRDLAAIGAQLRTPFTISGSLRPVAGAPNTIEVFAQLITLPDQRHRKVVRVPLDPSVPKRIVQTFDPVIRASQLSR